MTSIGKRIGIHRRQRNITQEQLAETMGVTSQAVSKWENDISCPDISVMPQLADYFGVSLDQLIRGETPASVQLLPESQRKDASQLTLRMIATTSGGDFCKVNLPLPLVKAALEISLPLINTLQLNNDAALSDTLGKVDFQSLVQLAESGAIGKLFEAKTADGNSVELFIE